MKKLLYAFFAMLFALGALSITGCSGDLNDYAEKGIYKYTPPKEPGADDYEVPAVPDSNEHWFLIGEPCKDTPNDPWTFSEGTGNNAGKFVLTFKPKRPEGVSWGGDGTSNLVFFVTKLKKSELSWPKINDGNNRYGPEGGDSVTTEVALGESVKLAPGADNTNTKITGLDGLDGNTEYTVILNPDNMMLTMVKGDGADGVQDTPAPDSHVTIVAGDKVSTGKLTKKQFVTSVTASGTSTRISVSLDGKLYKGSVTPDATATTLTQGTDGDTVTITTAAGKKYVVTLEANNDTVTLKAVTDLYRLYINGNVTAGNSNANKDGFVEMERLTMNGYMMYHFKYTAAMYANCWGVSTKGGLSFKIRTTDAWDGDEKTKWADAALALNGDFAAAGANAGNNKGANGSISGNALEDNKDYTIIAKITDPASPDAITCQIIEGVPLLIVGDVSDPTWNGYWNSDGGAQDVLMKVTERGKYTIDWTSGASQTSITGLKFACPTWTGEECGWSADENHGNYGPSEDNSGTDKSITVGDAGLTCAIKNSGGSKNFKVDSGITANTKYTITLDITNLAQGKVVVKAK